MFCQSNFDGPKVNDQKWTVLKVNGSEVDVLKVDSSKLNSPQRFKSGQTKSCSIKSKVDVIESGRPKISQKLNLDAKS